MRKDRSKTHPTDHLNKEKGQFSAISGHEGGSWSSLSPSDLVRALSRRRARYYSQNGEDGVIEALLEMIGIENKFYVEFGVQSGKECNTRWLLEQGWAGVMMDCDYEASSLQLYREHVTAENVCTLFAKYKVPRSFDLLSIDIDGNDYWVWKALGPHYRPRLAVIEFNAGIPLHISVTSAYLPEYHAIGNQIAGQSLLALKKLSAVLGYALVFACAPNAFLVRCDLLPPIYHDIAVENALWDPNLKKNQIVSCRRWEEEVKLLPWVYV